MLNEITKRIKKEIEDKKKADLVWLRDKIIPYIESVWEQIVIEDNGAEDAIHSLKFHEAIWTASTSFLPGLEVQVVVDDNFNLFISSGSPGFVGFPKEPKGLKLPIRCWIHTHPFGRAYFSGIDWNTVSIWGNDMDCAYVLGGGMHYGFWEKKNPNELTIYQNDLPHLYNDFIEGSQQEFRIQTKSEGLKLPEPKGE